MQLCCAVLLPLRQSAAQRRATSAGDSPFVVSHGCSAMEGWRCNAVSQCKGSRSGVAAQSHCIAHTKHDERGASASVPRLLFLSAEPSLTNMDAADALRCL